MKQTCMDQKEERRLGQKGYEQNGQSKLAETEFMWWMMMNAAARGTSSWPSDSGFGIRQQRDGTEQRLAWLGFLVGKKEKS